MYTTSHKRPFVPSVQDLIVNLPTGYGKSVVFQMLPELLGLKVKQDSDKSVVLWQGSIGGPEYSTAHRKSRDLARDQLLHPKWKIKTNDYTNLLCMSRLFLYVEL